MSHEGSMACAQEVRLAALCESLQLEMGMSAGSRSRKQWTAIIQVFAATLWEIPRKLRC